MLSIAFFVADRPARRAAVPPEPDDDRVPGAAPAVRAVRARSGLAFLTFTATNRLFDQGGLGVLAWLALLGLATYGLFWVWTQYRKYAI